MAIDLVGFVRKWNASTLTERSAAQQHFRDLCEALGVPHPTETDEIGASYTFEKRVRKVGSTEEGFADVWKRGWFAWEYKSKGADLNKAYRQLNEYHEALENPPLLVVCDFARFEVHTKFENSPSRVYAFTLDDLLKASDTATCALPPLEVLRAVFGDFNQLRPKAVAARVTEAAAADFLRLAQRIELEKAITPQPAREQIAHFLMRLIFCLFADSVELLPNHTFRRLVENDRFSPLSFNRKLPGLFEAMSFAHGSYGVENIPHFNGGLFSDDSTIALDLADLGILYSATQHDWSHVEPAIFGTLFERSLDAAKRSMIGAHYTSAEDILLIVEPVVVEPLRRRWEAVKERVLEALNEEEGESVGIAGAKAPFAVGADDRGLKPAAPPKDKYGDSGAALQNDERKDKCGGPLARAAHSLGMTASKSGCAIPRVGGDTGEDKYGDSGAALQNDERKDKCEGPLARAAHSLGMTASKSGGAIPTSQNRDVGHPRTTASKGGGAIPPKRSLGGAPGGGGDVSPGAQKRGTWGTRQTALRLNRPALNLLQDWAGELSRVRVLDPACGSGNFLYLALKRLLDLWHEARVFGMAHGLTLALDPIPHPGQLFGIETDFYAHEIASVVVWIGFLQWKRDHGVKETKTPILERLTNIEEGDAILRYGKRFEGRGSGFEAGARDEGRAAPEGGGAIPPIAKSAMDGAQSSGGSEEDKCGDSGASLQNDGGVEVGGAVVAGAKARFVASARNRGLKPAAPPKDKYGDSGATLQNDGGAEIGGATPTSLRDVGHPDSRGGPYEPEWPKAHFIIGNPPFLGDKKMRGELDTPEHPHYVDDLRALYEGRVPGGADLVTFWFEKARAQIEKGEAVRAGLLATNSISMVGNRPVLERIKKSGDIFMAWADRPRLLCCRADGTYRLWRDPTHRCAMNGARVEVSWARGKCGDSSPMAQNDRSGGLWRDPTHRCAMNGARVEVSWARGKCGDSSPMAQNDRSGGLWRDPTHRCAMNGARIEVSWARGSGDGGDDGESGGREEACGAGQGD